MARGDLTDAQWAVLEPLLPRGAKVGRSPIRPRRQLIDGIRFRVARNRRKLGSRGGRPPRFDAVDYRERHAVECGIN
jgi:transposase